MLALRSSSTAAATVAAAGPTNQFAEPPAPRLSCCRRAGRRPRETAAAARRGPSTQTQCTHCAARARRPPTSRPPPQPPRAFSRSRRACAAVAARGGTRADHPSSAQCMHWAVPVRRPQSRARRKPANQPCSQRFLSGYCSAPIYPLPESAHAGRFPTFPPVPALLPFSTTNAVVENGARPTLLRC